MDRNYPWEQPVAPDTYDLRVAQAQVNREEEGRHMNHYITDDQLFLKQLGHLSRNKAPGPDGIPNELLQYAPDIFQQALHKFYVMIWYSARNP